MIQVLQDVMPILVSFAVLLLGSWLIDRREHRKWRLDNMKLEYRQLIDGLFDATEAILTARPNLSAKNAPALADAVWSGTRLIQNRIFIAHSIKAAGIPEAWMAIANLAHWEPGEPEIVAGGKSWKYTQGAVAILRKDLEQKLLALAEKDLGL